MTWKWDDTGLCKGTSIQLPLISSCSLVEVNHTIVIQGSQDHISGNYLTAAENQGSLLGATREQDDNDGGV